MSIERLLQRPGVKKVVDPGTGTPLLDKLKEQQNVPTAKERNTPTPIHLVLHDISARASSIEAKTKQVIASIKQANYSDKTFKAYYDTVASVQVSIEQALKDPKLDIIADKKHQKIKALERSVYLNSQDPRAPFVQSLFDALQQTGAIRMLASTVWQGITAKTELYDEYSDDPIARYAVWRVNSELTGLLGLVTGVEALRPSGNSDTLAQALSEMIVQRSSHLIAPLGSAVNYGPQLVDSWSPISVSTVINDLDDLLGKMKKLHVVLDLRKLDLAEHWEKLGENLKSTFQTVYRHFLSEAVSTLFFSLAGQVTNDILDFVDSFPVLEAYIHNSGVFHELVQQAEFGLLKVYQNIEENVLGKERRVIEHREITSMMIANSAMAGVVGGNIAALAAAVSQITAIKQKLSSLGGQSTIDTNSLRTYLQ